MCQTFKDKISKANNHFLDNIPKFLKIVYQILEEGKYDEYIGWSHDGRAVIIKKPTEFAEKLLPIYFKHSNYSSFVRQLNLYSFRKKKHYSYDNAFAHTMFLKGRKDLLRYVKRKNSTVAVPEKPSPRAELSSEEDTEYDELMRQNTNLKKVHEEMADKLKTFEDRLQKLNDDNELLQQQYHKKKNSEEFLRKVIVKIAKIHGTNSIRELIESVAVGSNHRNSSRLASIPPIQEDICYKAPFSYEEPVKSFQNNGYTFQNQFESEGHLASKKISLAKSDPSYIDSACFRSISTASTNPDLSDMAESYYEYNPHFYQQEAGFSAGDKYFVNKSARFLEDPLSYGDLKAEGFSEPLEAARGCNDFYEGNLNTNMMINNNNNNINHNSYIGFDFRPNMIDSVPTMNTTDKFLF